MTTTLDRHEVDEIYGLLAALAEEQRVQAKRLDRLESDILIVKSDVKVMKTQINLIVEHLGIRPR